MYDFFLDYKLKTHLQIDYFSFFCLIQININKAIIKVSLTKTAHTFLYFILEIYVINRESIYMNIYDGQRLKFYKLSLNEL